MNRIPLTSLYTFKVTAECTSFTQAAERLFVTQGAVSKQIKQLEEYLKLKLFHRYPHHIALTESGTVLQEHVVDAFKTINQGVVRITQGEKMHLRILVAATFATRWLANHLHDFHTQYPSVELTVLDAQSKQVSDCEIIYAKTQPNGHAKLLKLERNIAVCAANLFDNDLKKVFAGKKLLHILANDENRLSLWKDWLSIVKLDVDAQEGLSFCTQDQVINATVNGLGIAIIDQNMIMPQLQTQTLVPITPHVLNGPYGYWLSTQGDNPAIKLFGKWIVDKMNVS